LIFVIIPITISFLLGEVLIRKYSKTGYITPEILKNLSLQYDKGILVRNIFPQRIQKTKGEAGVDIYINEKGYRGKSFEIVKPKGVTRIIFYGGSSVFDIAASDGKDWPHRVENLLKIKGFKQVEIINAGIPSNSSFEAVERLFAEGHLLQPDYVVISDQWNDIKYFRSDESILRQLNIYAGKEDPLLNYRNSIDRFLAEHSQLYVRLRTRYYLWKYKVTDEGIEPPGDYTDKISNTALQQYRLNIAMFIDLARNIHAIPILMTEPRLVMENNNDSQKSLIKYRLVKLTHLALVDAFNKTDEIIKDIAKEKKVELIDTGNLLKGQDELFRDQVHTTENGSEKLAEIVADEFVAILNTNKL